MSRNEFFVKAGVTTVLNWLDRSIQVLCVIFLATVLAAVTWQVLARYVTRASSSWTVDLAALAFVWLAMLSISLGVRQGRHMVFDVWEFFKYRRWLTVTITTVASALVVLTALALTWYGIVALPSTMRRMLPGLKIPSGFISLAVPVGCALSVLFAVEAWARTVFNKNPDEDPLPSAVICEDHNSLSVKGEL